LNPKTLPTIEVNKLVTAGEQKRRNSTNRQQQTAAAAQ
jgi:hypothetical protein